MKLQTLQILQISLRHVHDHGQLSAVRGCSVCVCVCVCGVFCVCGVVGMCGVCVCGLCVVVCVARLDVRRTPSSLPEVQQASVCTLKTPSCVPAKRPHVSYSLPFHRYLPLPSFSSFVLSCSFSLSLSLSVRLSLSSLLSLYLPFSSLFSSLPFTPTNTVQSTDQQTWRPTLRRLNVMWRTVGSQHPTTNCTECCHLSSSSLLSPPSLPHPEKTRHL